MIETWSHEFLIIVDINNRDSLGNFRGRSEELKWKAAFEFKIT